MSSRSLVLAMILASCSKIGGDGKELFSNLNYTYETYISEERNINTRIYLSHFLQTSDKNDICFENGLHYWDLKAQRTTKKIDKKVILKTKTTESNQNFILSFVRRITPGFLSKNKKPKVLVIGDSVTSGYGSSSNKKESWRPDQYWAYAKMFFEMEKIDNGDVPDEYNALFLGSKTNGDFTLEYHGVNRLVNAKAEGFGGAALNELFDSNFGGSEKLPNRFYDSDNKTFSILSYLDKYRTLDDDGVRLMTTTPNPAGERVTGSDGKLYSIGTEIKSQKHLCEVDVCTPSIVVISMCHNTTLDNYKANIGSVVEILRKELPEAKIVIMTIDETGTMFPQDYSNYIESQIAYSGLHDKNAKMYNFVKDNIENEADGVYVFGAQFIMPTVESFPTVEENGISVRNPSVLGANYHPNNIAHAAWGYALYSMIKYLITE